MKRQAGILATTVLLALQTGTADAATTGYREKALYHFCRTDCLDGHDPTGDLIIDASGDIYGTTYDGGSANDGAVFELVPNGRKYDFHSLYAFGVNDSLVSPVGDLILDKDGNLYGTTFDDTSAYQCGAVFKLTRSGSNWIFAVINQFAGTDGCNPAVGLTYAGKATGQPWDEFSPLFGTTLAGGAYGNGVAYELVSDGSLWNETVIHNFQTSEAPTAIVEDPAGNLRGTTESGGKYGGGLMYKLDNSTWKETILYQFCVNQNCTDGYGPDGRLFLDGSGNIFGTTRDGGSNCISIGGCGTVFELTAGGTYQVIYSFCSMANCTDGTNPWGGVIMNASGNLVGTTQLGGTTQGLGDGVAYELANNGGVWTQTVLHTFCSKKNCKDGEEPDSEPVADSSGRIFGVAAGGSPAGTLYSLKPRK